MAALIGQDIFSPEDGITSTGRREEIHTDINPRRTPLWGPSINGNLNLK
jgi:hypothetical protein